MSAEPAHLVLRRETRIWHDRVEHAFAPFSLDRAEGLCGFLLAQARVVPPLEQSLERHAIARIIADWPNRRRTAALEHDLVALGASRPAALPVPDLGTLEAQLGTLYVLEGSRLGGAILARQVASVGDLPTTYLRHRAGPGGWAAFLEILDTSSIDRDALVASALTAFQLFHDAACLQVAASDPASP